jgi:hypothetical protein
MVCRSHSYRSGVRCRSQVAQRFAAPGPQTFTELTLGPVHHGSMVLLLRAVRVILLLLIATMVVGLLVAIGRPETGVIEKFTLAMLVIVLFGIAVSVTVFADRLRIGMQRP